MPCPLSAEDMEKRWNDMKRSLFYSDFAWDHCYDAFRENMNIMDIDEKSINEKATLLDCYLGTFKMKMWQSFLMRTNHTIHQKAIELLRRWHQAHGELLFDDISTPESRKKTICKVEKIITEIKKDYEKKINSVKDIGGNCKNYNVTPTFLTKTILATTSYTPGYDTRVGKALGKCFGIKKSEFKTIPRLCQTLNKVYKFAHENREQIEECQGFMKTPEPYDRPYSIMRIVDIHFFDIGGKKRKRRRKTSGSNRGV